MVLFYLKCEFSTGGELIWRKLYMHMYIYVCTVIHNIIHLHTARMQVVENSIFSEKDIMRYTDFSRSVFI
jgi:hypothetical protein